MTFATADNFVNDMLKQPDDEGKVCKYLTDMARPSMIGLSNLATMFGFGTNKAAFNAAFGTGHDSDGNRHENVLWGTNGVVQRNLALAGRPGRRRAGPTVPPRTQRPSLKLDSQVTAE